MYLKPNKERWVPAGCLLKSIKPLHDLADSGDYWNASFETIAKVIWNEKAWSDLVLFLKRAKKSVKDLLATYLDDSLVTGKIEKKQKNGKKSSKLSQEFLTIFNSHVCMLRTTKYFSFILGEVLGEVYRKVETDFKNMQVSKNSDQLDYNFWAKAYANLFYSNYEQTSTSNWKDLLCKTC